MYLPRPEGNEKAEPGEEEDTPIEADRVEERDGAGFLVDWVDFWLGPEDGWTEHLACWCFLSSAQTSVHEGRREAVEEGDAVISNERRICRSLPLIYIAVRTC